MKPSRRQSAKPLIVPDPLTQPFTPEPSTTDLLAARYDDAPMLTEVARNLLAYAALLESQGSLAFSRRLVARATELLEAVAKRRKSLC
jgi:hypothetical protein